MMREGKSRTYVRNEAKILQAAHKVFAENGFKGATMEAIAALAEMSQPNLHNYFRTKLHLYLRILDDILDIWLEPISEMSRHEEPSTELRRYIVRKLELSRLRPDASRIFAHEMLDGARHLLPRLTTTVREQADAFASIVQHWIGRGSLRPIDPYHLLFSLWAITQHYADFAPQIKAVLGRSSLTRSDFDLAAETVCSFLFAGLIPTSPRLLAGATSSPEKTFEAVGSS
jgi:TetR/AcrR family transcriptional regulator